MVTANTNNSTVNTDTGTRSQQSTASGTGETITVKEMLNLAGVSKVTLMKLIRTSGLQPVGKVASGGRGRPAALFDRDSFLSAIRSGNTSTVGSSVDAAVPALSVDQINSALSDME